MNQLLNNSLKISQKNINLIVKTKTNLNSKKKLFVSVENFSLSEEKKFKYSFNFKIKLKKIYSIYDGSLFILKEIIDFNFDKNTNELVLINKNFDYLITFYYITHI